MPPWKDLPHELIASIANFLSSNPPDFITFRSLCKSFHSSLPFPSHLLSPFCPLLLPPPSSSSSSSSSSTTSSCILTTTSIYSIRPRTRLSSPTPSSSFNWIVFFDELNHGTLTIRRPFSRFDFVPPLDFPTKLYLSDFKFDQLGTFYNVSYVDFSCGKFVKKGYWNSYFDKVVVFGNGVGLVSLYSDGKLGFLRFGDGCEWRVLGDGEGVRFHDVVEFKGRVLGIDGGARVYEMVMVGCDDVSIKVNAVVPAISGDVGRRKRLIESFGCLYLVVSMNCDDDMSEFQVYVMNEKVMEWVQVNGIDGRVFLFGPDFSVACDAHKFDGLIDGNCIVFYDYNFSGCNVGTNWLSHFKNSRLCDLPVSIYRFEAGAKIQPIKLLPSYSSLFWPPPMWIWPNEVSKLSGTFVAASNRLLKGIFDDELKATYQEVSFKIRAIVAGDGISQHELHKMLKNADMHLKFLNDIVEEVEKDTKIIETSISYDAEARRQESLFISNFINNQAGTSCSNAEDKNGSSEDDWVSSHLLQAGTSSFNAEDKNGSSEDDWVSSHLLQAGTSSFNAKDKNGSSEDDWVSNEISKRLGTHVCLKRFLNRLIGMFDRK